MIRVPFFKGMVGEARRGQESHVFPVHLIWVRCEEDMSLMRKGSFGTEPQDRAQVEQILDQVVHAMEQHAELAFSFRKNACKCGEFLPYSTMSPFLSHSRQHIYKSCLAHRFGSKCDRPKATDIHFKMQAWHAVNLVTGKFLQFGPANPESTFSTGKTQWKDGRRT